MEVPVTQRTWVILASFFFCPPFGYILALTNPRFNIKWRISLVGISIIWVTVCIFAPRGNTGSSALEYINDHPFGTATLILPILIVVGDMIFSQRRTRLTGEMSDESPDSSAPGHVGESETSPIHDFVREQFAKNPQLADVETKRLSREFADEWARDSLTTPLYKGFANAIDDVKSERSTGQQS